MMRLDVSTTHYHCYENDKNDNKMTMCLYEYKRAKKKGNTSYHYDGERKNDLLIMYTRKH